MGIGLLGMNGVRGIAVIGVDRRPRDDLPEGSRIAGTRRLTGWTKTLAAF